MGSSQRLSLEAMISSLRLTVPATMAVPHNFEGNPRAPNFHGTKSFASILSGSSSTSPSSRCGKLSTFKGEHAFLISRQELQLITEPFKNLLVRKFVMGRPSMDMIRKFVTALGLKEDCPIGLLDDKHILLRLMVKEDFTRLWCRHTWYIMNRPMILSKWTIDFRSNQESSLTPVWVSFPDLPFLFLKKNTCAVSAA